MASSTRCLIDAYIDLLKLLECPVCYEFGSSNDSPSKLCKEGHFICGLCARKVSICPSCKSNYSNIRVRILDQIKEALIYPCSKVGCGAMIPLKDLHSHEQECACVEEDHSLFNKNVILAHNILKHIEDYYAPFYMGHQENIHEGTQKEVKKGINSNKPVRRKKQLLPQANNRRNMFKKIDKEIQCSLICTIHQCTQPRCTAGKENGIDTVDSEGRLSTSFVDVGYEKCFEDSEPLYLNVLFDQ